MLWFDLCIKYCYRIKDIDYLRLIFIVIFFFQSLLKKLQESMILSKFQENDIIAKN